jgi:hypothetical protein
MQEAAKSAKNEILAPRMFPLTGYGTGATGFTRLDLDNPAKAPDVVKQMAAAGLRVISMDPLGWSLDLVTAIAKAAKENGMITSFHLQPSNTAVTNAVKAACAGVTMIEHHYGYAESALDRQVQDYGREYDYGNENDRFRYAGKVWLEANRERLLWRHDAPHASRVRSESGFSPSVESPMAREIHAPGALELESAKSSISRLVPLRLDER